jgi:hypothetical protein
VALRDIAAYQDWLRREHPPAKAQQTARSFIAELGDQPWLAPSVPIAELSLQPDYEVRYALLPVGDEVAVEIWYRHEYATEDVDLIAITADR